MKIENQYIIHFKGLKEGIHDFAFTIGKPFFEAFEQLEVPDGNLDVQVELNKRLNFWSLTLIFRVICRPSVIAAWAILACRLPTAASGSKVQ